jgi:uncharacterized protein
MSSSTPASRLTGLWVYPIKSIAGIPLNEAEIDAFGITFDRRWMVVDPSGVFISQREIPRLALLRPRIDGGALTITAADHPPLSIPLDAPSGPTQLVTVWADTVAAREVPNTAPWLTRVLGVHARLVHMHDDTVRPVDPRFANGTERVSFADGFPFLLISEGSLHTLNEKLATPLPMNRFRPNLVVDGVEPHAEDGWTRIQIGEITLDVVKPCARCVTTTVDQATAERSKEPLRTLATYRKVGSEVMFGQNVIHRTTGRLQVGDRVTVVSQRDVDAACTGGDAP